MKIEQPIAKLEFESGKVVELTEEEYEELKNYFSNMFLIPSIPSIPSTPSIPSIPTIPYPYPNPVYPQSPTYGTGAKLPEPNITISDNTKCYTNKLVDMAEPDF